MSKKIQLSDHFTYPRLLRFVAPSIVMMIFTSIYYVVDGFFVSNYVGKTPFAALNFIMPFIMILGGMGFIVGTGGSALVAKELGCGHREKANRIFTMMIGFVVVVGLVLTVLGIAFIRPIARLMQSLKDTWVNPKLFTSEEMNRVLGTDMEREYSLHALATRPGVTLKAVAGMTKTDGAPVLPLEDFSDDELFQAETEVKYSGYISRQKAEIERTLANETLKIPAELDYDSVPGLSFEVRQKLKSISPETIGQASRISGVTPAAVSLLLVHLKRRYYYVKDKGTQAKEKGNV